MRARDLYSQEPVHLASFSPERLQILHSSTTPRRLAELLPPSAAACLRGVSCMELRPGELAAALARDPMPTPYWDAELCGSTGSLLAFLRQLYRRGLVSLRRRIRAEVGVFFVHKKQDQIR